MPNSEQTNEQIRAEWRDLGFYYDFDDTSSVWRFIGSAQGLSHFAELLRAYVAQERSARIAEHEHFGPYWYLKVMTWDTPQVSKDGICGSLTDLGRLASLIDEHLQSTAPSSTFEISTAYAHKAEAVMLFDVREPGFDPAGADPLLAFSGCKI